MHFVNYSTFFTLRSRLEGAAHLKSSEFSSYNAFPLQVLILSFHFTISQHSSIQKVRAEFPSKCCQVHKIIIRSTRIMGTCVLIWTGLDRSHFDYKYVCLSKCGPEHQVPVGPFYPRSLYACVWWVKLLQLWFNW
jgi:hypothetical protein